jgi:hypothetical protein
MSPLTDPTPQERLASSRKAIVRHMSREKLDHEENPGNAEARPENDPARFLERGTWSILKHALGSWWRHHPVSVAVDIARPVVGRYAEEKPLQLLGIAAAAGAAAVVLRPWRLVSLGGLLVAALKSSELSGTLLSMLSGAPHKPEKTPYTP